MRKVLAVSALLAFLGTPLLQVAKSQGLYDADVAPAQDESSYVPYEKY